MAQFVLCSGWPLSHNGCITVHLHLLSLFLSYPTPNLFNDVNHQHIILLCSDGQFTVSYLSFQPHLYFFSSEVPHKVFCWPCLTQWSYPFPALYPNGPFEHGHPKWIENSVKKPVFFIITSFFSCSLLDLEEHSCVSWYTCQGWRLNPLLISTDPLFCSWDVKRNQRRGHLLVTVLFEMSCV